jgi:DNA-directed RNA polymerase specialized sigma24 family protein
MAGDPNVPTSPTLLGRLGHAPADQAAWAEFADRYGRKIYGWCRQWGLQEADAEDVTQQVLLKLADKMRTFILHAARSETLSNTWKLRVMREAILSWCLVGNWAMLFWMAARKSAKVG